MKNTKIARTRTDSEIRKMQLEIKKYYDAVKGDVQGIIRDYIAEISKQSDALYDAINSATNTAELNEAKNAYKAFYSKLVKSKGFKGMSDTVANKMLAANEHSLEAINERMPLVYSINYNGVGKDLDNDVRRYNFKPITPAMAVAYSGVTRKHVNKRKDLSWNKKKIARLVITGSIGYKTTKDIFLNMAIRTVLSNSNTMQRNASDLTTDAESKGRLDSMYRASDEGNEIKKKWVATLDNVTRPTHQEYDSMDAIPLDDEWAEGLSRPRDPNAELAEIINCRCEMIYDVGQEMPDTRAAREGDVTGIVTDSRSFKETKTVHVETMTYEEWMKWRSSR